jgi:hypothetical protein
MRTAARTGPGRYRRSALTHDRARPDSAARCMRSLDVRGEFIRAQRCGSRLDPEEVDTPGQVSAVARADSRMRRRNELRTTALPQAFPIAYPTWGNIPSAAESTGTKVARTGPQLARESGSLQLTEGSAGLYSSNRPGGHEQLRR